MSSNLTPQEGTAMPTFDTPEPITATIDLVMGDVRISADDRGATVVEVHPSDASNEEDVKAAELTRVEYADEQLLVKAPKLRSWLSRSDGGSIDVTIALPAGSHVHGAVGLGDFQCDGRLGDCRIKTGLGRIRLDRADKLNLRSGAGDISVDRATGRAEVTASSGDVRLGQLDTSAVIKNSNGDTWVGAARGDLRINAANGNIAVDLAQASVAAKSANGDVRLGEVVRGSVVLETKIGDLEVGVREGTAAWLDVNARFGHLHNALDAADAPETSAETVEVRARTSVGEVVIRRP
jgi:Putative adhesin